MLPPKLTQAFLVLAALVLILQPNSLTDVSFIFPFSIAFAVFYFLKLFLNFGKKLIFIELLELLNVMFLLFTPALFAQLDEAYMKEYDIYLPVAENYFRLAIPSVMAILFAFSIPLRNRAELENLVLKVKEDEKFQKLGMFLFMLGVGSTVLNNVISLGFIGEFLSGLAKVGILYLLFSGHRLGRPLFFGFLGLMFLEALGRGMIGEFFWWLTLLSMFYLMIYPMKLWHKVAGAATFIFLVGVLNVIKHEYRSAIWFERGDYAGMSSVDVYRHLLTEKFTMDAIFSPEQTLASMGRLNQGYLTSMAIEYTPSNEPFAKGETIFVAVASSIVPRALWPNKPEAGGAEKMMRFCGFDVQGSGMNIGLLGEAYVNFGFGGAAVFLFLFALFLNYIYTWFLKVGQERPYIVLWLPLAFFGALSVETDFVTVLNHIIKFFLFFFFFDLAVAIMYKTKVY
jgi:predicted small integral membrane protein